MQFWTLIKFKKKKTHNKIWKIRKIFSFLSIIKKILYVSIRIFVIKSSSHKYYRDSTESNGNINQEAPPTSKNKLHEAERTFQHAHLVPFFHTHILFVIYLLDSLPEYVCVSEASELQRFSNGNGSRFPLRFSSRL